MFEMIMEIIIGLFGLISCVALGAYGLYRAVKFFKTTKALKNNTSTGEILNALDEATPTVSLTDQNGKKTSIDASKYTILHDRAQINPLELYFKVGDETEFREYIAIWEENNFQLKSEQEKQTEKQWHERFIQYCLDYQKLHKTQYIPVKIANATHVNGVMAVITGKEFASVNFEDNPILPEDASSPHPNTLIEWDVYFPGFEDDPTKFQPIGLCSEDLFITNPEQ